MPYVTPERRELLDKGHKPLNVGELNFCIHKLLDDYLYALGVKPSYSILNGIIGVLQCVQLELYRRLAADYEDQKIEENGDVSLYKRWRGVLMGTKPVSKAMAEWHQEHVG